MVSWCVYACPPDIDEDPIYRSDDAYVQFGKDRIVGSIAYLYKSGSLWILIQVSALKSVF